MNRTIVLLHPGALGDVLLAVPAIRRIKQQYPHHQKLLIARGPIGQLLVECGVVESWIDLHGQDGGGLFLSPTELSEKLQAWLQRCDVAVVWTEDRDGVLATTLRHYGVKKIRIRSPFSLELRTRHQMDRFLETVDEPAVDFTTEILNIAQHRIEQGRAYLEDEGITNDRPIVLVHPGSGSIHKCLKSDVLARIIEMLVQAGMSPLVLEGPADRDIVDRLLKSSDCRAPVLRELDLPVLAGLLVCAKAYIGHDSGITHLSALLGARTIAVFGPTDPHRWAPRGSHVTILRGEPCVCATWETVKTCIEKPCLDVQVEKILDVLGLNAGVQDPQALVISGKLPCLSISPVLQWPVNFLSLVRTYRNYCVAKCGAGTGHDGPP